MVIPKLCRTFALQSGKRNPTYCRNKQQTPDSQETMQQELKKYTILENETKLLNGHTLYRIQALKDFNGVKAGENGGWIEGYHNLSQDGNCWIYDDAVVYDKAYVYEDACVFGSANVFGKSRIYGYAQVFEYTMIYDNAEVFDNAHVFGHSVISNFARVFECAEIYAYARVHGNAQVFDYAKVCGNSNVYENAQISGKTWICGNAEICGNVKIVSEEEYLVFKNHWSSFRHFTYTKTNKMWKVGCFYGSGEELIEKAYQDSELSGRMYEKYVRFVETLEQ